MLLNGPVPMHRPLASFCEERAGLNVHLIIIMLTALLGLGLAGHGKVTSGTTVSAPHARAAMDVQPGGGPS